VQQVQRLVKLQSKNLFYDKKCVSFMGSWKLKFNAKRHPQEFQVAKYIRTMSSHHLVATNELICKRFGLEERIVQNYVAFLIGVGEIQELEQDEEIVFVTEKWFLTKEENTVSKK
jgi:hypothetical protein